MCVGFAESEWTEWFDRDDERGSGDWEKLSELHKAFPERLCSNPLDIEVDKHTHTHTHTLTLQFLLLFFLLQLLKIFVSTDFMCMM